ncbi:MAG TPA: cobalamin biosynthesis protein [Alphaproteobacteria bacterium]|nr:cobalamin biosynthesis protein [Alphaproteobacteria bacterium]
MTAPPAALILLAALALDAALLAVPSVARAAAASRRPLRLLWAELARRLDRPQRSTATLSRRGVLLVLAVGAAAAAAGWMLHRALARGEGGWIVELVVLALLLGQRDLFLGLGAVRRALAGGGLAAGRAALVRQFGGGAVPADEYGVVRLACAAGATRFVAAVTAPAFWYALLGLGGLFACAALLSLAAIVAGAPERDAAFGRPAALMRALLLWLPARLGAILLAAATVVVPGARPGGALKTLARDRGKSPDAAGWPVAALAGGLGLSLGGPPQGAWIGDGRARAESADLKRATYLLAVGCLLDGGAVAVLAVGLAALR